MKNFKEKFRKFYRWFMGFAIIIIAISITGCTVTTKSADRTTQEATEKQMKEINAQVGMPAIKNFQEKKLAKQIFELRDRSDLVTYVYLHNKMSGKLVFIGKAIGFGLPYSVQYTNPERIPMGLETPSTGNITVPQADPNGLFMPDGLSATWVMLLDEEGEPHPVYIEQEILVSPFELNINLVQ